MGVGGRIFMHGCVFSSVLNSKELLLRASTWPAACHVRACGRTLRGVTSGYCYEGVTSKIVQQSAVDENMALESLLAICLEKHNIIILFIKFEKDR